MPRRALSLLLFLLAGAAGADLYTWVDAEGHTHVTDDPGAVPEAMRARAVGEGGAQGLWGDGLRGPPIGPAPGSTSSDSDRVVRLLRGALDDLARGESARAAAALESALRLEPGRPEAHFYLALLDRQRGRFESAASHLRSFLAGAGEGFEPWRESAARRLRELEDEQRLAAEAPGPLRMLRGQSTHFRVDYDAALGAARPDWIRQALGYLEEAHAHLSERLGLAPREPTAVLFYGKAAYLQAHRHRFSFRTVGFFDGRIHVAAAAHPGGELRSLLHHEYTHALFRERVGSDRPMWLNEGLAELSERASRGQPPLSRSERFALRERSDAGRWIPLARLEPGFGGLDDEDAAAAYLEVAAAAAWIEARSDRAGRARLLALLGEGRAADQALREVVGTDTAGLEAALVRSLAAEFPALTPAKASE